ncbi:MAG TPA: acyltransferase [Usitatibacter sp.]|nr:acyltransferase [Usitatibacter sp.]
MSAPDGVRDEIGHIPGIDGLRGIAVLWVALFHFLVLRPGDAASRAIAATPAGPLAANGYLGVDLFFIISGFLLAMPWFVHAAAHRESPSVLAFYRRRFWRIVPAYYVQLAILFGLVLPALRGVAFWRSDLYVYLYNLVTHALFLHNTTPLSSGSMQVNGALWTLAVEAQFYLLLPLAMPVVVRWPRASLLAAIAAAQAWRVAAEVDLVPLVRLEVWLGRPWGWPEDVVRHLLAYQLPSYLGHFALGMYLGREWLSRRAAPARPGVPDAAAAMAIVALGISLVQGWPPGRFAWTAAPLALCVLLYAAARGGTWTSALLARGPLAFTGRVSYSMYLYHLPLLLVLAPWLDSLPHAALPAYLAAAIAAGWISWRFVERPWMRGRPKPTLAARAPADGERGPDGEDLERGHAPEHQREAPRVHERAEH